MSIETPLPYCEELTQHTAPAPARFAEDSRCSTQPRDHRILDHVAVRRPSPVQADAETPSNFRRTVSTPSDTSSRSSNKGGKNTVAGPMDAWLHTQTIDMQIMRAAKILASVDEQVSEAITSQIRELTRANAHQLSSALRKAQREAATLKQKLSCAETAILKIHVHARCRGSRRSSRTARQA